MTHKDLTLGDLLIQRKDKIKILPDKEYLLVTISNKGKVKLRSKCKGKLIRAHSAFRVKSGDFIYSRLSVHTGAFGLVPEELDNAIVTNEMPCFEIRHELIIPDILLSLMKSFNVLWQLSQMTKGAGRVRVKENMLLRIKVSLPSISKQFPIKKVINQSDIWQENLIIETEKQKSLLKKYRQAILQQAIEGNLTEDWRARNPHTRPASELIKNISYQKYQFIKQKKIKKQNSLSTIKPNEAPFKIPRTWQWCRLGDLGYFCGGGTPSKSKNEYWHNGNIPWITPKDMKKPQLEDSLVKITQAGVDNSSAKIIPPKSLLFVVRGMILIHTFPTAINICEVTMNQDMKALIPFLHGLEYFLLMCLNALSPTMLSLVRKSTHGTRRLEIESYLNLLIPLPPFSEQQEIVRRVEEKFTLCNKFEAEINTSKHTAETLSSATLQEFFKQNNET